MFPDTLTTQACGPTRRRTKLFCTKKEMGVALSWNHDANALEAAIPGDKWPWLARLMSV